MQQIAAAQDATLVSYTVLWNGAVLIWVIQPNGSLTWHRSDEAAAKEDLALFAQLRGSRGPETPETPLTALVRGTQGDYVPVETLNNALERLYNLLIAPIQAELPTNETDRVIFIPHQELFQVPFAALRHPDTQEYLIQHHTISTAPSILSLALTEQRQTQLNGQGTDALIVGNPTLSAALVAEHKNLKPLPGAEAEAKAIAQILNAAPAAVLLQDAATQAAVMARLPRARYVHLATHGFLQENPTYSTLPGLLALAPSPDDARGEFTAQEVFEFTQERPLTAELVVLSACRTGQGAITSDGAYGLSRAFLIGGTPSLIVSLWDASDQATQLLMTEFYSNLLGVDGREPLSKAQALRQAMLTTMEHENRQYGDPRDWAAFTLMGQPD
jgi:CHAT domain-containing protein